MRQYLRSVIAPIVAVTLLASILPVLLELHIEQPWMRFAAVVAASLAAMAVSVGTVGLTATERRNALKVICEKLHINAFAKP